jgi:hypothetical protein
MRFTPPRFFLTLDRVLILSAAVINFIQFFPIYATYNIYVTPVDSGLVKPDNYQPPLIINIHRPFANYIQNDVYSYRKFSSGDYTLLCNIRSTYAWSCIHGTISVGSAITSLSPAAQDDMELAFPVAS